LADSSQRDEIGLRRRIEKRNGRNETTRSGTNFINKKTHFASSLSRKKNNEFIAFVASDPFQPAVIRQLVICFNNQSKTMRQIVILVTFSGYN
jgi:hypothetical protein